MMRRALLVVATFSTAAMAADEPRPRIMVTGTAAVMTPPDIATIAYRIVGEGPTSDEAVTAMVAKRQRIASGTAALDGRIEAKASEVSVAEVRSPDCKQDYGRPRLSTGPCAVIGYIATLQMSIRTGAMKQAGTLVGLVGRLGGSDPRLSGYTLADVGAAQRRAIAAALLDAKAKVQAIAQGSGVTPGRLIAVSTGGAYGDAGAEDVIVTATQYRVPPPPPPPPPPVAIDLTPRPIETRAQVSVTYEIAP